MSVTNKIQLRAAIANTLRRDVGDTLADEFIVQAESYLATGGVVSSNGTVSKALTTRDNYCRITTNILVSDQYFKLPVEPTNREFLRMGNFQINTDPPSRVTFRTPEQLDRFHISTTLGRPIHYTVHGSELEFKPVPDATYEIEMGYWFRLAALVDDGDTNTVIVKYPNLYLYGALLSAEAYLKNDKRIGMWKDMYVSAVNSLVTSHDGAAFYAEKIYSKPYFIVE